MGEPGSVLLLRHHPADAPGAIKEALASRGFTLREVRVDEGDSVPETLEGARAVVAMGGPMSAYDLAEHPFLGPEKRLLAEAARAGVPVLGVCLGGQILAAALGAVVKANRRKEIGWLPVSVTSHAAADPLFTHIPATFVPFHWHGDVFECPAGAVPLARSAATPVQAFRFGEAAYGVQFHLESTAPLIDGMLAAFGDEASREGLDPAEIRVQGERFLIEQEALAAKVFGAFADRVAQRER